MADASISIDPTRKYGDPRIGGTQILAVNPAGLYLAGETAETAQYEYGITRAQLLVACWYLGIRGGTQWRQWRAWAEQVWSALSQAETAKDYAQIPLPPQTPTDGAPSNG